MNPTANDLFLLIGEQAVKIRLLESALAQASQEKPEDDEKPEPT